MNYYNEYDKPIKFKGDIIITDPCYIMRKENCLCTPLFPNYPYPNYEDYYEYGVNELKYPDLIEQNITLTNPDTEHDTALGFFTKNLITIRQYVDFISKKINELTVCIKVSPTYQANKKAYDAAYGKYCSIPQDDWDYCDCGSDMKVLGFTHSAVASTLYGDWGCTTYEIADKIASVNPKKVKEKTLGEFCADAGLVAVFLVDEVMKYNPKAIEDLKEKTWCATFIDNFDGEITFAKTTTQFKDEDEDESYEDTELRIFGDGNIKFITSQTSL